MVCRTTCQPASLQYVGNCARSGSYGSTLFLLRPRFSIVFTIRIVCFMAGTLHAIHVCTPCPVMGHHFAVRVVFQLSDSPGKRCFALVAVLLVSDRDHIS